jgi:hypothetical protein
MLQPLPRLIAFYQHPRTFYAPMACLDGLRAACGEYAVQITQLMLPQCNHNYTDSAG